MSLSFAMLHSCLRRFLFALPPESAHHLALSALRTTARIGSSQPPRIAPCTVMGLSFANPLGLAAGFDKNADCADGFATLGFGFIEVGAITPQPQSGNPTPRIFRLPSQQALINRMGFNNCGMQVASKNLSNRNSNYILGINLGKNAQTALADAADDYIKCMECLYTQGDFFTINISSPNTKGLRDLQSPNALHDLLHKVIHHRDKFATTHNKKTPIAVKLSPDLSDAELQDIAAVINQSGIDGVIACNTTQARPESVQNINESQQSGGLSGAPLREQAMHVLQLLRNNLSDDIALIASGGVMNADDVIARLSAGASLVQIYTGLIYGGPQLPRQILNRLNSMQHD